MGFPARSTWMNEWKSPNLRLLHANLISAKVSASGWKSVHGRPGQTWPIGVVSTSKLSTCFYLPVHLARALRVKMHLQGRERGKQRTKHYVLTSLLSLWNSLASFNLHFFLDVFLLSSSHKPITNSSCLLMVSAVWPNKTYHNPDWILRSKYLGSNLDPCLSRTSVIEGDLRTGLPRVHSTLIGSVWFQFVGRPRISTLKCHRTTAPNKNLNFFSCR